MFYDTVQSPLMSGFSFLKGVLSRKEAGGLAWVPELVTISVRACMPTVCNDLGEGTMGVMLELFRNVHWSNM